MFPLFSYAAISLAMGVFHIAFAYIIETSDSGKIVKGATIQFKVEIFKDDGTLAKGDFHFFWKDLKFPENNATYEGKSPVSYWNLTCGPKYTPGNYTVQVEIEEKHSVLFVSLRNKIGNKTIKFEVTQMLNGDLVLSQGNFTRKKLIDSSVPLNQSIVLKPSDLELIKSTKNFTRSYWFIDCVYYGHSNGFDYFFNYSKPETNHLVEALLISTIAPENFTYVIAPFGNSSNSKNISKDVSIDFMNNDKSFMGWLENYNKTHVQGNTTVNLSQSCLTASDIPLNNNYTYGLFSAKFTVKEPVKVSPINGTNWLQDGEILNITVSCTGSSPFKYCLLIREGLYNVTGKEICREERQIKNCSFNIQHLFTASTEYTIVVFISNSVSQVIKPIAVNIYKVTKHPQLSVIIVPVAFSIVAVILIIFGVAYYVQSKRSCTVEVADFDFANQSTDMEYKSFRERLRESVSNLFLKSNDFNDDDEQVWSPTRKRGESRVALISGNVVQ